MAHLFLKRLVSRQSILLLFVLIATCAIYWQGLLGGFIFDDFPNIVYNAPLRTASFSVDSLLTASFSSDSGPLARPLSMLSFAIQIAAVGLSPFAFKLANLLVHLTNGLVIYCLSQRILLAVRVRGSTDGAGKLEGFFPAAVTAAWLLAPINLTSVLFVVQRMESLSTLFMLLGLLAYLHGRMGLTAARPGSLGWMIVGLVFGTGFGVLAKETAVAMPAYAFILEWMLFGFRRTGGRWDHRVLILFGGVLILPGVMGLLATLPSALSGTSFANRPFTLSERLFTESRVLVDYLRWIVFPPADELSLYHDDYRISTSWLSPPSTLMAILFLGALLSFTLWLKNRRPLITLGLLFFFTGHALVSTYLPLELVHEHRNYLPSFGVFLSLFAFLFLEPSRADRRALRIAAAVAVIAWSGFLTFLRANEWSDPVQLAFTEAARHPESPRANYELGHALIQMGPSPASPGYSIAMKSFEVAAGLPNAGLLPVQGLIFMKGKHGEAIDESLWKQMERTIAERPLSTQDISGLHSLLDCLIKEECSFDATRLGHVLRKAAEQNPTRAVILTLQANHAVNIAHDFPLGLTLMQRTVALGPKNPQYWKNLIVLQTAIGQLDEARAGIERLRELDQFGLERKHIETLEADIDAKAEELARSNAGANA